MSEFSEPSNLNEALILTTHAKLETCTPTVALSLSGLLYKLARHRWHLNVFWVKFYINYHKYKSTPKVVHGTMQLNQK